MEGAESYIHDITRLRYFVGVAEERHFTIPVRKDNRSAVILNFVALARPRARAPD